MRTAVRTLRPYGMSLLLVAVIALLSWPGRGDLSPGLDTDGAWEIGIRQALHDGLDWGPDLQFTYGPLGFLHAPMLVYPWSARISFAWWVLMQLVLVAALLWALTHALGSRVLAVIVSIALAATLGGAPDLVTAPVLACLGATALAAGRPRGRWAPALALALGALGGVFILDKLNTGITVVMLGVVAIAAAPSPRRALALPYAGGFVVTAALGWTLTGQSLTAIPDYVQSAVGIVSGYSEAMMAGYADPRLEATLWAAGLASGLGLVVAWRAGDGLPTRGRAGLVVLWAVFAFTAFKAGFVRHGGNSALYFAALLGGLLGFGWAAHRRQTALLIGVVFAFALWLTGGGTPRSQYAVVTHVRAFADQARLLADGSDTNAAIAAARAQRTAVEQVDPRLTTPIGRGTVHVYPHDAGLVWSAGLHWRPLPIFQAYSAYTADLDRRNAEMVRSPAGPDFILSEQTKPFDGRNPAFESPAAVVAMLCHFRTAAGPIGRWALLRRSPDRCGPERPLATARAHLGEPVPIPPAPDRSSIVLVRIEGIEVAGLEKLRTALYRARLRQVTFDGPRVQRLVPGTAAAGLLLRVPRRADYPPGFALDQQSDTIAASVLGRQGGDLRFRFSSMSIR